MLEAKWLKISSMWKEEIHTFPFFQNQDLQDTLNYIYTG